MPSERLDPRLDLVFKVLLTREQTLLRSMLEAVLGTPIGSFELLNPDIPGDLTSDKAIVLDVRVRLGTGERIDVEMQIRRAPTLVGRLVYYTAKDFSNQLVAGQDYGRLTATVVIVWLVSPILDPPSRLHFSFSLREDTTHEPLTDLLRIHVLQLSACRSMNALSSPHPRSILERWACFLSRKGIDALAQEDPIMATAKDTLDKLSADPQVARAARERADALHFYRMDLQLAREEGVARGREEGVAQGREQGREEGMRELVLMTLEQRFGTLPERVAEELRTADVASLRRLLATSFEATSLEETLERVAWGRST